MKTTTTCLFLDIKKGIPSMVYYAIPLHMQTAFKTFKKLGYDPGDFPFALNSAQRVLSFPMHPYLDDDRIEFICDSNKKIS